MDSYSATLIAPENIKWSVYDHKNSFNLCNAVIDGELETVKMVFFEDEVIFINPKTRKELKVENILNVNYRFKPLDFLLSTPKEGE